jgi:hypothetical protein
MDTFLDIERYFNWNNSIQDRFKRDDGAEVIESTSYYCSVCDQTSMILGDHDRMVMVGCRTCFCKYELELSIFALEKMLERANKIKENPNTRRPFYLSIDELKWRLDCEKERLKGLN